MMHSAVACFLMLVWCVCAPRALAADRAGTLLAGEEVPRAAERAATPTATELNNQGLAAAQAGRWEEGAALVRQAMARDPADAQFRTNLSGILTDWATQLEQRGQTDRAVDRLREAIQLDAANGHALVQLGNLYFVTGHELAKAIALWTQAHAHLTSAQWQAIAPRVSQAERDVAIERAFVGLQTAHFQIRFEGEQHAEQATAIGAVLERTYARLSGAMGVSPPTMPVIVYTRGSFQRIAGRRDWAFGLYDGRIRVRLDDVGTEWGEAVLAHELAHAFLATAYGPRIPLWMHEGFAQAQEPPQPMTPHQQELLASLRARTSWVPLKWLDRRFTQPSALDDVERAYLEARLVMETLIAAHGLGRVGAFIKAVAQGQAIEQACDQALAPRRWARVEQGILD